MKCGIPWDLETLNWRYATFETNFDRFGTLYRPMGPFYGTDRPQTGPEKEQKGDFIDQIWTATGKHFFFFKKMDLFPKKKFSPELFHLLSSMYPTGLRGLKHQKSSILTFYRSFCCPKRALLSRYSIFYRKRPKKPKNLNFSKKKKVTIIFPKIIFFPNFFICLIS